MKTTRRGLLGWLAALTGAAAVAKVAPAAAEAGALPAGGTLTRERIGLPAPEPIALNPYALPPEYQAILEATSGISSVARGESLYAGVYEEMQRAYGKKHLPYFNFPVRLRHESGMTFLPDDEDA